MQVWFSNTTKAQCWAPALTGGFTVLFPSILHFYFSCCENRIITACSSMGACLCRMREWIWQRHYQTQEWLDCVHHIERYMRKYSIRKRWRQTVLECTIITRTPDGGHLSCFPLTHVAHVTGAPWRAAPQSPPCTHTHTHTYLHTNGCTVTSELQVCCCPVVSRLPAAFLSNN